MTLLVAHQRQYVLGPAPVRLRDDWITVSIADGLVLSHCPKLAIRPLRSRDGVDCWLLGLAVPTDQPGPAIAETFGTKDWSEIEAWTWFWAGRWLLISNHLCCQDATGSLAVNYREVDGALWLSSSAALLGDHLPNTPLASRIPWHVQHAKGMDWIPAPFTTREGIYKLLPQRAIDPANGAQRPVRSNATEADACDAVASLASALQVAMVNWAGSGFTPLRIALTAGLDTRTVLAAAVAARIDAQSYTNLYAFMKKHDRLLPPRLAALAGIPHIYPNPAPVDPEVAAAIRAIVEEHMDGTATHPSFDHFAEHGPWSGRGPGSSTAHGVGFELGRCFFWRKFAQVGLGESRPTADEVLAAFAFQSSWRPEPPSHWQRAIQSWLDTLSEPVPLAPDWRDRFYLDQRLGSWSATVQRAGDFVESTAFNPGNCLALLELLLRPEPQKRQAGALQREAIRLMAPQLLRLPINPMPISKRLKRGAKRLIGLAIARRPRRLRRPLTHGTAH